MIATIITGALSLFGSAGFGSILGMAGAWLTKREERENAKLKYAHDIEMQKLRVEELKAEQSHELAIADKEIQRAQTEGQIKVELGELGSFSQSLKEQTMKYGGWVDKVRGLIRPLITVYLLGLMSYIAMSLWIEMSGLAAFDRAELFTLFSDVINKLTFLTCTCILWWFGGRMSQTGSKK